MTLVQSHFAGRWDAEPLNNRDFIFNLDQSWTQFTDRVIRLRFEVSETAGSDSVLGGTLEARKNTGGTTAGSWFDVTTTSGTVQAAGTRFFYDTEPTIRVLRRYETTSFVPGEGSEDGVAAALTLNSAATEHEFCARVLSSGVASGDTVDLRLKGLQTYEQFPTLLLSEYSNRAQIRLLVGDTDASNYLLTDAEIDFFDATWHDNSDLAAADAALAIAGKYARDYDFQTDQQGFTRSQRVNQYTALAEKLRGRSGIFSIPLR